MLDPTYN